jgi:hypothetical protein
MDGHLLQVIIAWLVPRQVLCPLLIQSREKLLKVVLVLLLYFELFLLKHLVESRQFVFTFLFTSFGWAFVD